MTRYGYIGLGQMGSAMVQRLIGTGAEVHVFDLDPETVQAAAVLGAHACDSVTELAAICDIVSICVPAAPHVHAVVGDIGLAARFGQTILVHSTVAPETMRDAARAGADWGGSVHDACVAGGVSAAKAGELVILAGGLGSMAPVAADLLRIYGSLVIDGGPVGGGAALKLGFNLMTYAQFGAAAAAFNVAESGGADPTALIGAWRHVGQLGKLTENFLGMLTIPADKIVGSFKTMIETNIAIARKDLELASDAVTEGSTRQAMVVALGMAMPEVFGLPEQANRMDPT